MLHVERQHTKEKLPAGASNQNSVNIILHCITHIVTLIAGGEGRTMSEYSETIAIIIFCPHPCATVNYINANGKSLL